jgi:ribosomal protein S18 acetylase RimI-like enzyme
MPNGVRLARTTDVEAVSALQLGSWRTRDPQMLEAAEQSGLDVSTVADLWRQSLLTADEPLARLFVATDANDAIVGFAATSRASDDDSEDGVAELLELIVDPAQERAGHGSRLLAAAADTLARVGVSEIVVWRSEDDERGIAFLTSAGFAPDGARRVLASDAGRHIEQVRMCAATDPAVSTT